MSALQWVIDAYNLVFACLLLTSGTLAGLYGGRRIFALGIALLDRRIRSVRPCAERRDRNRVPRAHRAIWTVGSVSRRAPVIAIVCIRGKLKTGE